MAVSSCDVDELFRLFTLPPADLPVLYLLLDVRDIKYYKKGHISQSFSVRLSTSGTFLAEYSKANYKTIKWSTDVWVGRTVYVYGDAGLSKSHPAVAFLASGGCKAVKLFKEGYEAFAAKYGFLCNNSTSAKPNHYPSQILPGELYLGDWDHALDAERLKELHIRGIVTIHNNPENMKPHLSKNMRWLPWELPDVETADISSCFNRTYEFIEEARAKKEAVLVHCGAGVSRSAALVCMYLMRRFMWSAHKAKEHCISRRGVVCPNDGFWRTLCALEPTLGITNRSDPNATAGYNAEDAPAPAPLSEDAVGGRVGVEPLTKEQLKQRQQRARDEEGAEPAAKRHQAGVGRSINVTLEIRKPGEGVVGGLLLGPIAPHQRVIFGRLPSNEVVLEHASISRQHAALSVDVTGSLMLTDLQSGHGTKLEDTWIKANTFKTLRKGSVFHFGASTRSYTVAEIEKL